MYQAIASAEGGRIRAEFRGHNAQAQAFAWGEQQKHEGTEGFVWVDLVDHHGSIPHTSHYRLEVVRRGWNFMGSR
ncbi:hypothetical protein ACFSKY_22505 [Azotobacter chroococcum]|uniref:Uncharacterized protein n=1 Tax=Azotobacter chroococcum TaxID=353 RepID=A0A4R1PS66_9GAMM|nr:MULTISPECIES: hypothetical protein [Azotobacter]MDV7209944.1 hypothetical protein [Azotobacter beijerinckii]TBV95931.1 hypothetical protein E0E53_12020 [Azotobacter chroococcum]TCL26853.1 hypothetical protein EV691_12959 [Azotobacter chroococcum]